MGSSPQASYKRKPLRPQVGSPNELLGVGPQNPPEQKGVKRIKTGYTPRKLQLYVHNALKRFNVLVCHRRFGKTVLAINHLIHRAVSNPLRNPQYAYIMPTYKQAKRVAWQYLVDYTRQFPGVKPNVSELIVYIPRPDHVDPATGEKDPDVIKIMLIGADDPDDIRGLYLDGVVIDEFAQCDPIVWSEIVRPALGDRGKIAREAGVPYDLSNTPLDPWAIFIGTPKGQNHFFKRYTNAQESEKFCEAYEAKHDLVAERFDWDDLEKTYGIDDNTTQVDFEEIVKKLPEAVRVDYKEYRKYRVCSEWYTALYRASETGVLPLYEIEEMIEDLDEDEIAQELECSFNAAIKGAYYGKLLVKAKEYNQITALAYDPRYPVDTFWDIGIGDKTTIWFRQKIGGKYHYIDYYEMVGRGVGHYIEVLRAKSLSRGSKTELDDDGGKMAGYGYRYGRHIWPHDGKVQEWGTGQSRQETARKLGLIVHIQAKQRVEDRIQASRDRIKISFFDAEKCADGLNALSNYQKKYDTKLRVFMKVPLHDWSSHSADSFGYSALDDSDSYFPDVHRRDLQTQCDSDYDELAA